MSALKITGLEEHFLTTDLLQAWRDLPPEERDLAFRPASEGETSRRLLEIGPERIKAMDETGLDVQVLSLTTPGGQNLPAEQALEVVGQANDYLAAAVAQHPDRFQGLASLPTGHPEAAAEELERAVTELGLDGAMLFGRTGAAHLDHARLWAVYEVAERRRIPLHLHPQSPPSAIRDAYYSGFDPITDSAFATYGVGWHYDAGVEFLRMVVAGVFDRFPNLQVIVGHWGELVLFFLERIQHLAKAAGLPLDLHDYVRSNLIVAPSGILSPRYLRWAGEVIGVERIVFSTDYPFEPASRHGARAFLDSLEITGPERALIASNTWDQLRGNIVR